MVLDFVNTFATNITANRKTSKSKRYKQKCIRIPNQVEAMLPQQYETPPRRDLFYHIRLTMRIAAMYPLELQQHVPPILRRVAALLELLLELFLYFAAIHICMLYVCTVYLNYKRDDLEFLVNCLIQTVIYFWTIAMKLYFRRMRPQLLRQLLDYINLGYMTRSALGFTYVTMDESLAKSNRWIKVYVYCCFLGTIFWLILPVASGERTLPLSCWYPFDYKARYIYEAMYLLQSVGQIQVAAAFSASSGLYMVLAILISGQYDVLCCSLKNIVGGAYISMGAAQATLQELQQLQQNANAELNQYYCAEEHTVPLASLPSSLATTKTDFLSTFKRAFKACVLQHRYILRALRQMEHFFSPIWFCKMGEVILLLCLVAFVSVKSTTANSSFMKVLSLSQYLLLVAWELLIICYFGQVILLNSGRCGEALLRCPWYLHMREMRRDFQLFLLNSQRTFKLTAGKIYNLNVDRFRSIVTTAFSFLTLLQKMDARQ